MNKVTVNDINFRSQKVLLRVDFNVPLDENQNITDDSRIKAALPTIKKILSDGGIVIACSHLGRPKGKHVAELSLKPCVDNLSKHLGQEVLFAEDCIGPEASNIIGKMTEGQCLLLENLRFHKEETDNDPEFSKKLASLADIYVNDAFGTAHRAHASTVGVTEYFQQSIAGYLIKKEIDYLGSALDNPTRPFAAILGGAKISGKIDIIENLIDKVDILIIGGGMVFTFAKAMGYEIGDSLLEEDKVVLAKEIIDKVSKSDVKLYFPSDAIVASDISDSAETEIVEIDSIPDGKKGLDIGPKSIDMFKNALADAKTIMWNGPMGVFEYKPFENGTFAIAKILGELSEKGAITIVGGGDSAAAVRKAGLDDKLSHISTGGGASLEFMEGKILPGIAALTSLSKAEVLK
jgi:phosphoglycerate kinase